MTADRALDQPWNADRAYDSQHEVPMMPTNFRYPFGNIVSVVQD